MGGEEGAGDGSCLAFSGTLRGSIEVPFDVVIIVVEVIAGIVSAWTKVRDEVGVSPNRNCTGLVSGMEVAARCLPRCPPKLTQRMGNVTTAPCPIFFRYSKQAV